MFDPSEGEQAAPQLVIWGTDVVVNRCKAKFKSFISTFVDPNAEEDEISDDMDVNKPLYLQKLDEVSFKITVSVYHLFLLSSPNFTFFLYHP